MKSNDFKISFEGEDAEKKLQELADLIKAKFKEEAGQRLAPQIKKIVRESKDDGPKDGIALALLILSIPAAVMAAIDLVERLRKKEKIDILIQWAKDQPVPVTITTPQGITLQLKNADSGILMDAATTAVKQTNRKA